MSVVAFSLRAGATLLIVVDGGASNRRGAHVHALIIAL
jgi:hypothetical protein